MWDGILLYVVGVNIVMLELLEVLELQVLESLVMFWMHLGIISYVLDAFLVLCFLILELLELLVMVAIIRLLMYFSFAGVAIVWGFILVKLESLNKIYW